MKNIFFWGTLALSFACLSGEQASAWINSQFGVGLNWHWMSGGNSFLWGMVRDGQPGGPEIFHTLQAAPAYPQPQCCVPAAPAPHYPCSTATVYPQAPIPVPAVAPVAAPSAAAPANSSTQSLYRPYGYGYYYQPRR